jgi:hypothetical protein
MTERELLELAARASGIDAEFHPELGYGPEGMWLKGARSPDNSKYWNPLTDDGDALRLAVKLRIVVDYYERRSATECACAAWISGANGGAEHEELGADPHAATRRAIVRAAAEIGKAMP